jgi:hypothetical protein
MARLFFPCSDVGFDSSGLLTKDGKKNTLML